MGEPNFPRSKKQQTHNKINIDHVIPQTYPNRTFDRNKCRLSVTAKNFPAKRERVKQSLRVKAVQKYTTGRADILNQIVNEMMKAKQGRVK